MDLSIYDELKKDHQEAHVRASKCQARYARLEHEYKICSKQLEDTQEVLGETQVELKATREALDRALDIINSNPVYQARWRA